MNRTACLLLLLLAGCAAGRPQIWYKPGGSQREFDIDARECEIIARHEALAASERGRDHPPEVYAERYEQCLVRMGWSRTPPATAATTTAQAATSAASTPIPALGALSPQGIQAFGATIAVPQGAVLIDNRRNQAGPTVVESFLFRLPDRETYLNIILQQSDKATFPRRDYPVPEPYHLYASGREQDLRWAALWGPTTAGGWVKALGAYGFFGRHQRLTVVLTAPLAAPAAPPPAGLLLTADQYHEMTAFVDRWRPWITTLMPRPGLGHRAIDLLGRVLKPF